MAHACLEPPGRALAGAASRLKARRIVSAIALLAGIVAMASHLRADGSAIFWIRAGAIAAIVAAAVQSVWDTALRTPANGVLFAVVAAVALHDPRIPSAMAPSRPSRRR